MMITQTLPRFVAFTAVLLIALFFGSDFVSANIAGGGTGKGSEVMVTDHGDTVALTNGIASILIVKKTGRLDSVTLTHTDAGATTTTETLSGKGQYYYGGFSLGNGVFEYSLATDPASNGGDYADVKLLSSTESKGVMEIHFSMHRGSQGFYSTAMMTHRPQDERFEVGAWGVVTRVPPTFNWLSADSKRNFFIGTPTKKGVRVPDSPHEITVNLDGTQAGNYADKFIYGMDHADLRAWGWSSVGEGGANVGRWIMTNMEFSNGGPLKRDVSVYPYSELNNSILTGEVGMGSDGYMDNGEVWTKTCGAVVHLFEQRACLHEGRKAGGARAFCGRAGAGRRGSEGVAVFVVQE
jgi:rhamnogalacturonan endolyase